MTKRHRATLESATQAAAPALRSPLSRFVRLRSIRNLSTRCFRNRNKAKAKQKKRKAKKKVNLPCGNLHFNCHLARSPARSLAPSRTHRTESAIFSTAAAVAAVVAALLRRRAFYCLCFFVF